MAMSTKRRGQLVLAVLGVVVLVAGVPWGLVRIAHARVRTAEDAASGCRTGRRAATQADRLYRLAGLSPPFSRRARRGRADLVGAVVIGYERCLGSGGTVAGTDVDADLALLSRIVRDLARAPDDDGGARFSLEALLHHMGRDRQILSLARRLPKGGNVLWRVTAALHLGDPKAAARFWQEPGATLDGFLPGTVLYETSVLCLSGDTADALSLFAAGARKDGGKAVGANLFDVQAECLLRAHRLAELKRLVSQKNVDVVTRQGWLAEAAIAGGDLARARALQAKIPIGSSGPASYLRGMWLAVETGDLHGAGDRPFAHWLESRTYDLDPSLFYSGAWPALPEGRLRDVADALAKSGDERLRHLASLTLVVESVYLGRRWDPRFAASIARAKALDPGSPLPSQIEAAMAFFHDDWKTFDAAGPSPALATLQTARARLLGRAPTPASTDPEWNELLLGTLIPGPGHLTALAQLHESGLPPAAQMELLARQSLPATFASQLYRLTNLIRHGELLGKDTSGYRAQLKALRKMYDAQPDPYLLESLPYASNEQEY